MPRWPQGVSRGLSYAVGHRLNQVCQRRPKLSDGLQDLFSHLNGPSIADRNGCYRGAVHLCGQERHWRRTEEQDTPGQLVGDRGYMLAGRAAPGVPCTPAGRKGPGAALKSRTPPVSSSGTVSTCWRSNRRTSFALVKG